MPEEFTIPANGNDIYRCFVLPTNLTEDKDVVAVEYRAGNKAVVHHCLGFLDVNGDAHKKDAEDPGQGYLSFGGPGFTPAGELGGWAPGNLPRFTPEGIGRPLPKGSDVVLQVHYHPNGREEKDKTQIGIYFAKKPIQKKLRVIPVPIRQLEIPAGDAAYTLSRTYPVPIDIEALFIAPHMHLLGNKFEMIVTLPDGIVKPMVKIDDWDFRWQDTYAYQTPLKIPKGSTITLTASYNNSPTNPRNPNSPPKKVTWGEGTTDEMCIGFIGFVATNENDPLLRIFDSMLSRRKTTDTTDDSKTRPLTRLRERLGN